MKINYKLNDIEKDLVVLYVRCSYIKRFSICNRVYFLSGKIKNGILLYIPLVLSCYFVVLSLVFPILLGFTLNNISIYMLSLAFGFYALGLYKDILIKTKVQLSLLNFRKFMRKYFLMVNLAMHTRRILKVIGNGECNLNVHGDIGEFSIKPGIMQRFSLHTLIEETAFKEVIFYSFTDSAIGKRCLIPVPLRCLNRFKAIMPLNFK